MRSAFVRRTVLGASAVSLALLATACGGSDKADAKGDAKPSASASAPAPAVKGKSDAEMTPLLVTQAEAPDYMLQAESVSGLGEPDASLSTDKPECKVLLQSESLQEVGKPTGVARTAFSAKPKGLAPDAPTEDMVESAMGVTATLISLASYDGKGAEEALASVRRAGQVCAGGFSGTSGGEGGKVESVKPTAGVQVPAGDEAVSLTITMDLEDGQKGRMLVTVVRKANTMATFSSISILGKTEHPTALIAAQAAKLG